MAKFDDRFLKSRPSPSVGNRIYYDPNTPGLGLRITAAGAKAFVFNYRIAGRERRYTIGPYGVDQFPLKRARRRAGELRRMVERGEDPLGQREDARNAATVADLAQRFAEQHRTLVVCGSRKIDDGLSCTLAAARMRERWR
jgi:hypothetical protein